MKLVTAAAVVLLLGGCATMQQPKPSAPKAAKVTVKYAEPCPCSPTQIRS
jgi:PBP1b-binding outer membrane lipoprotein LpoB